MAGIRLQYGMNRPEADLKDSARTAPSLSGNMPVDVRIPPTTTHAEPPARATMTLTRAPRSV